MRQIRRNAVAALLGAALAVSTLAEAAASPRAGDTAGSRTSGPATPPVDAPLYRETWAKDFVMDAPWRVIDAATPIPILVALKNCGEDEIAALRWLRCQDVTRGAAVTVWLHDGGGERIGDDPDERDLCAWITTVTEGHPSLPDDTPLAPATLGYHAGDVIVLEVSIRFRDNLPWDQTATRVLHVRVGGGPFPWPAGWYGGDPHVHTTFTDNVAEWGAPVPALRAAAQAAGLHWLAATDHSCDLDETGPGQWSSAIRLWRCTTQTPAGAQTVTRDVFVADGTAWGGLGAEIAEQDGPALRLLRGVEINLASVDPATFGKTLHALFYDCGYVASPLSGAPGERPVTPTVPAGLDALGSGGFAYAAHPWDDLAQEWAGLDLGVNGAAWGRGDFTAALARGAFRGVEAFNTRITVASGDDNDPWDDFAAGHPAPAPYPAPLLAGIARWDSLVRAGLAVSPPWHVLLAGGSDAHGDLNYATRLSVDEAADDNALGKVQTVVRVPGAWEPGDLPPAPEILAALRAGRSIATDGPFVTITLDRNRDGAPGGPTDLGPGDDGSANPVASPDLLAQWASLAEFGPVVSLRVLLIAPAGALAVAPSGTMELFSCDPRACGWGYGGSFPVQLSGRGLLGRCAVRAEVVTADGAAGHRAFTNPIWITFDSSVGIEAGGASGSGAGDDSGGAPGPPLALTLAPDPARTGTEIQFTLDRAAAVTLTVYDLAGRRVRSLLAGASFAPGTHRAWWDGRGDRGERIASGVYAVRLDAGRRHRTRTLPVVR